MSEPVVSDVESGSPARIPVPEIAAGSLLALVLLAVGAVVSVLLRRRSGT